METNPPGNFQNNTHYPASQESTEKSHEKEKQSPFFKGNATTSPLEQTLPNPLKTSELQNTQSQNSNATLSQEFMGVIDTLVQEGYETAKPIDTGKSGDQGGSLSQDMKRDLQVIREFLREANYKVEQQSAETAQMLNMIKVELGGAFWQKLQQALQKTAGQDFVNFQKSELASQENAKNASDIGKTANESRTDLQKNPGPIIAELLKAEGNPHGQNEHFLTALALLGREGMPLSTQKLISYLKRRGGLSEQEWQTCFSYVPQHYLAGVARHEKNQSVNWWYIFLALLCFGAFIVTGMGVLETLLVGGGLMTVMWIGSLLFNPGKKR